MSTYNQKGKARTQARSPIKTSSVPAGTTFEGHPGYGRDPKSELFLLASTQFMNQATFYEKAGERDNRLVELVRTVAVQDPVWVLNLTRWLRNKANLRSVALVVGLEAAKALQDSDFDQGQFILPGYTDPNSPGTSHGPVRLLAKAGIARADEPGEALAYLWSKYGRNVTGGIQRGLADKVRELYNEYSLLKYDTPSHTFRFADVIELTNPRPADDKQSDLFRYAIERRHGRDLDVPSSLMMVRANQILRVNAASEPKPIMLLNSVNLRQAGMNWEDALSLAGNKLDKRLLWEAMIPNMGYMALLRNLRNFDQAGVSDVVAEHVRGVLSDPGQVARSRQLPLRFLNAFNAAPSLRWAWPLEQALNHCLANVPALSGRTLVLVDTSGSMDNKFSERGEAKRWDVASLFGIALGLRAEDVDVVSFSGNGYYQQRRDTRFPFRQFRWVVGESLLSAWKRWDSEGLNLNGGTDTVGALGSNFGNHDRVVIITDEQAAGHLVRIQPRLGYGMQDQYLTQVNEVIPSHVPMHVINVAGYEKGMIPSGQDNRHVYGGLSDHVFTLIPQVEAGRDGRWPWEQE